VAPETPSFGLLVPLRCADGTPLDRGQPELQQAEALLIQLSIKLLDALFNIRDFDAEILQRYFSARMTSIGVRGHNANEQWAGSSRAALPNLVRLQTQSLKHNFLRIDEDLVRVAIEDDCEKASAWVSTQCNGAPWRDDSHEGLQTREWVMRMQWRRRSTKGRLWVCDRLEAWTLAGGFIDAPCE